MPVAGTQSSQATTNKQLQANWPYTSAALSLLCGSVVRTPPRQRRAWGLSSTFSPPVPLFYSILFHPTLFYSILFYSILFYSRVCPSTAGSSSPPESSIFLCPLLSSSIPLLVAPQCHLSNDLLVFRLILHPLSATLCF